MNIDQDNNTSERSGRKNSAPKRTRGRNEGVAILLNVLITAAIFSTIFVTITPDIFSLDFNTPFSRLLSGEPDVENTNGFQGADVKIGIVSGHLGNDSGAVCENGTTEADVNLRIATLVQQKLNAFGYQTDLLKERDPRLNNYKADLLISIHNDSCVYVNDLATGFKVSRSLATTDENLANRLEGCLSARYQVETGLPWHDSVTTDMTDYHAFDEIDPGTPAVIIETGFLNLDYELLVNNTELVAEGVTSGILCFINNESFNPPSE
ncbi:MAG TPA: N-acetylmuramoyl-L-alanine amidase [Anaerolineales bacterium]|nr:N-acetylmuramoyl-L-alanine amidase [Anaerolineales bacterium]